MITQQNNQDWEHLSSSETISEAAIVTGEGELFIVTR